MIKTLLFVDIFVLIAVVIIIIIWRDRLADLSIDFEFARLGIRLRSDTLTFMILIVFVLAVFGIYLGFRSIGNREEVLRSELEQANVTIKTIEKFIDKLKVYSFYFQLEFPPEYQMDTHNIKIQANIQKFNEPSPQVFSAKSIIDLRGNIWVLIDNLNPGDRLQIIAFDEAANKWESSEIIEIPRIKLKMTRVR